MKAIAFALTIIGSILMIAMCIVLAIGLGAGLILHWLVPSVDLSAAAICGTLATGFGIAFCTAIFVLIQKTMAEASLMETDDLDDSDVLNEDQVDDIAERLTEAFLLRMAMPISRSKPKTNRTR